MPPRHWKSTTIEHGVVFLFQRHPGLRVLYLTYAQDFAERQSRDVQRIARAAGLGDGERSTFAEWTTANGCTFRAGGLIGGATGEGFDLIIVDDPYRKRADAESRTIRGRTSESFVADVFTRQSNKPTSFLIVHTRWHHEDLIAEVSDPDWLGGHGFSYTNLPAINDDGQALLPKYWPIERLAPMRASPYEWASQYMGQPVPRGAQVFAQPATYDALPRHPRYAIGIDLAYTKKTKADYSVAVVLGRDPASPYKAEVDYVVDLLRVQASAPEFGRELRKLRERYPGAPVHFYASGVERGAADFIRELGVPVEVLAATTDKVVRATPASAAWNEGRILVPVGRQWVAEFVDEVTAFTGVGDAHDDCVDALAAAYHALPSASPAVARLGTPRVTAGLRKVW